ncbi:U4/U6 small nuclear ribonucleoprotein prp4 [Nowakowskiella sp. JEL0407]|nr:U4/U6 small nuclear ribonucleoprotein prp4 [Nowakowskiella sp. JEL0407]
MTIESISIDKPADVEEGEISDEISSQHEAEYKPEAGVNSVKEIGFSLNSHVSELQVDKSIGDKNEGGEVGDKLEGTEMIGIVEHGHESSSHRKKRRHRSKSRSRSRERRKHRSSESSRHKSSRQKSSRDKDHERSERRKEKDDSDFSKRKESRSRTPEIVSTVTKPDNSLPPQLTRERYSDQERSRYGANDGGYHRSNSGYEHQRQPNFAPPNQYNRSRDGVERRYESQSPRKYSYDKYSDPRTSYNKEYDQRSYYDSHSRYPREDFNSVSKENIEVTKSIPTVSETVAEKMEEVLEIEPIITNDEEEELRLIEERRNKRNAILQKFKAENKTSVLSSEGVVPVVPTSMEEAQPMSVDSPAAYSVGDMDEDEVAAADYDPNSDKMEDESRIAYLHGKDRDIPHRKVEHNASESDSGQEDDIFANNHKSEDGDIDMFGNDDDDDMFAVSDSPKVVEKLKTAELKKVVRVADNPMLTDNWDDPDGYYRAILGEMLDDRYHVFANVGKGVFSSVVRAKDKLDNDKEVAIKIIRNNEVMYKAGMKEANILKKLMELDPEDKKHVIRLIRHFEHRKHLCIVFESLSMNLRDVIKKFGKDRGLHIKAVRSYAHQLFLALSLLKKANILHADIKPDNILVSENNMSVKLCDLGSASDATENDITPYLVSRFYRAPEIILGIQYDFGIDVWSIACTLYELYTGRILFPGKSNNHMLRLIQEAKGRFNPKTLRKAQFASQHFDMKDPGNPFLSIEHNKATGKEVIRKLNFKTPAKDMKSRLMAQQVKKPVAESVSIAEAEEIAKLEEEHQLLKDFSDLLERCLVLNPEKRLTVTEALRHPFINNKVIN